MRKRLTSCMLFFTIAAGCGSVEKAPADAGGDGDGDGDGDNTAPVIDAIELDSTSPAGPIGVTCQVTDADGDAIAIAIDSPDGTITDNGDGSATWEPPLAEGVYAISCDVDDGNGGTASETLNPALAVRDGLLGRWKFEGDLVDSGPNGFTGQLVGGQRFVADRFGSDPGAVVLESNLAIDQEAPFDLSAFTIAVFIAAEAVGTDDEKLLFKASGSTDVGNFTLRIRGSEVANPGRAEYVHTTAAGGPFSSLISASPIPINQFVHLAVTFDGQRLDTYFDGEGQNSSNNVPAPVQNDDTFRIGGGNLTPFRGAIDEVRVYDRALGPDEVRAVAGGTL